jgi:hypothetical protein
MPSNDEPTTLFDALRILAETHTREDHLMGFVVEVGAGPGPYSRWSQGAYIKAWKIVREQCHMPTEPEKR